MRTPAPPPEPHTRNASSSLPSPRSPGRLLRSSATQQVVQQDRRDQDRPHHDQDKFIVPPVPTDQLPHFVDDRHPQHRPHDRPTPPEDARAPQHHGRDDLQLHP